MCVFEECADYFCRALTGLSGEAKNSRVKFLREAERNLCALFSDAFQLGDFFGAFRCRAQELAHRGEAGFAAVVFGGFEEGNRKADADLSILRFFFRRGFLF